ncbi:MAG: T9SS type A sorting domain-containing protein [Ignavibacteria bacterium]|nr:T9SS type A sorting domain-containing protein [Ignavibacteria bacterium]
MSVQSLSTDVPEQFSLEQNYPNPFNPKTIINYELRITNLVKLTVYDVLGHEVATLVNEKQSPGTYEVEFDASGFASGVYFYKLVVSPSNPLVTEGFTDVKRMMLVK